MWMRVSLYIRLLVDLVDDVARLCNSSPLCRTLNRFSYMILFSIYTFFSSTFIAFARHRNRRREKWVGLWGMGGIRVNTTTKTTKIKDWKEIFSNKLFKFIFLHLSDFFPLLFIFFSLPKDVSHHIAWTNAHHVPKYSHICDPSRYWCRICSSWIHLVKAQSIVFA